MGSVKAKNNNYVSGVYAPNDPRYITTLAEFTNGTRSGWMYTVNGKHPGVGLNGYISRKTATASSGTTSTTTAMKSVTGLTIRTIRISATQALGTHGSRCRM